MKTVTGLILDVSGSMKQNAFGNDEDTGGEWSRSIFTVMDNLIKHDVSPNSKVFAIGVGASCGESGIFDILRTIEPLNDHSGKMRTSGNYDTDLEQIYKILEDNGARQLRKWASEDIVKRNIEYDIISIVLFALKSTKFDNFAKKIVNDCLPSIISKSIGESVGVASGALIGSVFGPVGMIAGGIIGYLGPSVTASVVSSVRPATDADIQGVKKKIKGLFLKTFGVESILSVKRAREIIHGCVDIK